MSTATKMPSRSNASEFADDLSLPCSSMVSQSCATQPQESGAASQNCRTCQNVGDLERLASVAAGVALVASGIQRRSLGGLCSVAAGGALAWRGITGWCGLYEALGISSCPKSV